MLTRSGDCCCKENIHECHQSARLIYGYRIIPTVFLPLSLLSYTSIIGILSIVMLIGVVFIDGISKRHGPGSFWDPAETSIGFASMNKLGIAFGLFMAGVSLLLDIPFGLHLH